MKPVITCALLGTLLWGQTRPALDNTSTYVGDGRYNWTVFVRADTVVLDSIRYVEYYLHPTFPNPVRRVENRKTGFALQSNGWGEFPISAKVVYKNGKIERLSHQLRLGAAIRPGLPGKTVRRDLNTQNDSRLDASGQWQWTVYLVGEDKLLDQVACVEYTLHPTFPNPVQRRCTKGKVRGQGFHLTASGWGTFLIQVKVEFKDNQVQYLKHQLAFSSDKE